MCNTNPQDFRPVDDSGQDTGHPVSPSSIDPFLSSFLESLDMPAFCLDTRYRYTCFNKSHAEFMKSFYQVDISPGMKYGQSLSSEEREWAVEKINRALRGEKVRATASSEGHIPSHLPIETVYSPVRNQGGEIIGVSVITRTVTGHEPTESDGESCDAHLAGIIANSAAGIVYTDSSGNYLFTNNAFCSLTGYTHQELAHMKTGDLIHPDDVAVEQSLFQEIRENKRAGFRMELRIQKKNGEECWGDLSVSAICDDQKKPRHFIGVITDITARKRAESYLTSLNTLKEELLKSEPYEQKLKKITDAVVGIFQAEFARIWIVQKPDLCDSGCIHAEGSDGPEICTDRERCLHLCASSGRYTGINGTHRRIPMGCFKIGRIAAGKEKQFITNDALHDPRIEDHDWAQSLGLTAFAGLRILSTSLEPIGVLALFRKTPILPDEIPFLEDLANTISHILISAETDRNLRENKEFLSSIIENIPNMIFVKDPENLRFVQLNSAGEELLGYSRNDLIGKNDFDFFPPEEAEFFITHDRAVLSGNVAIDISEEEILTRTKGKRILHTKKLPVFDESGKPKFLLGISEDITEQKILEEERNKLKNHLEYLLGVTKTGIDIIDADYTLMYVDPAWSRIYGDYTGKKCFDYFNDLTSPCPGCGIPHALKTGEVTIKDEILSKEGNRVVEVHTIPYQDQNGDWFVAEFNIDVSDRKQAEDQMKIHSRDLEYLSRQSVLMLDLEKDADLFPFIGATISSLCPASAVVIVSEVRDGGKSITARFVSGLTDEHKAILGDIASSLIGRTFPLTGEFVSHLLAGGLRDVPIDLRVLSGHSFPEEIYEHIEKTHAVGKIYSAGLTWKENLQGSVVILLPPGIDLEKQSRMEIFLQLSAIELKRRQTAADLREERGLFIGGPVVAYKLSAQEGMPPLYVSPNILTQFGYEADAILNGSQPYESLIHPDDLARVFDEMAQNSDDSTLFFEQEYRIVCSDGRVRHVYDYTVIERDNDGIIQAYHGYILDIHDRKETERMLVESEANARALINAPKESIFIMKRDGTIIYANETMASRFGYRAEDIIGRSAFDVAPSDIARERKVYVDQVIETCQEVHFHDTRFGRVIENNLYPILDESGQVTRIAIYGRDVTEKEEAERRIAESEKKYRSVVEQAHDGIVIITGYRLVYANEAFAQMTGYSPDELVGMLYRDLFDSEMYPEGPDFLDQNAKSDKELSHRELDLTKKDGSTFSVEINAVSIDYEGAFGWLLIIRDISERKHAQDNLTKILKLLNETQEVTKLGGWEFNVTSGKMSWTEEVYHLYGVGYEYDPNNIKEDIRFYSPEDAPIIEAAFYRAVHEGIGYDLELKFIRSDARQIWVRTIGKPVLDDGRVVRVSGTIMDISERKQLEISLREALQKLKVLTGITRHDVINDLTAITLSLEIVTDVEDEATKKKYLSRALEASKVLEKTIGFTRDYEDFGTISSTWHTLLEIFTAARASVALGECVVAVKISPDLEIFTDPIIRKVFTTLLENSVRHGGENLTGITISTHNRDNDLVIIYEDNGVGIPADWKRNIFDHGFGKHTGIGLFLAREILSITGFSIRECGEEGKGARFEIHIPNGSFRYRP